MAPAARVAARRQLDSTGAEQLERLKELSGSSGKADSKRAQEYLKCAQDAKTADDLKVCGDKLK